MDIIYGMVSMVKDIKQSDREFKNINFQIKYTIQKALLHLKKISADDPNIAFIVQNLNRRISQAESISKRLDELLNAQSIAIQDKIRLSLPFNQTKNQAIKIIEDLEKAITDLKEEMQDEEKQDNKSGGVKRKISEIPSVQQQGQVDKNILIERENNEIDQHIEEIYEMGPTINDDELHFSQTKSNRCSVQFSVEIKGQEKIISFLQEFPDILKTKKIFSSADSQEISEMNLYTVARLNFQKCYNKIKGITKDIDRISTKGHFHFVIKRNKQEKASSQNENPQVPTGINRSHSRNHSSSKKKKQSQFLQVNNSKEEEEVFFSFPQDDKNEVFENLKVLMRKQDSKKVVYRFYMGQWQKIEEDQIEIGNGEKLAPFINPQTKEPTFYFQLSYGIMNG